MDKSGELNVYLAKTIAELDRKSLNFPSDSIKKLPLLKLCKCCHKLLEEAEISYSIGDMEMAYIKFSRYFTLIHYIRIHSDYNKYKGTITAILGSNKSQMGTVDKLRDIIIDLKERYAEISEPKTGTNNTCAELNNSFKEILINKPNQVEISSSIPWGLNDSMDSFLEERSYITCKELYSLITVKSLTAMPKEILFDCRPYKDYCESKIVHSACLNFDEEIIQNGVTALHLSNKFKSDSLERQIWDARGTVANIIIYDWSTSENEPIHDSPLHTLRAILMHWDPEVNYKSLKFLKGGFEEFLTRYPQYTTNPKVKPPPKIIPPKPVVATIEYPSIGDITMKEETFNVQVKNIPVINRDTKPSSTKYNTKTLKEMIEAREKLAEQSLSIAKQQYLVEQQIKDALIASERAQDSETKEKENQKVLELEYSVMELENSKQDIAEESIIVTEQITEEQEFIPDSISLGKIKEIEEKESEALKLNKINEQLAREKRLSETREIAPIKVPTFDRSIKPLAQTPGELQRNLETISVPIGQTIVRGLTGLKNLGNTCYMNSIIQCLSNTNSLAECFITRVYLRYISKCSKTNGVVVKNLASLIRNLWSGKYKSISPEYFRSVVGNIHKPFQGSQQQDAHEFLIMLIEWMHMEMIEPPPNNSLQNPNAAETAWLSYISSNQSLIHDLFYGQMKSTLKCKTCSFESATHDSFSTLSLELPQPSGRFDITDCLNLYFNGEPISGWDCPKCKQKRNAIKKFDITRLPPILILHLKRFYHNGQAFAKKGNYIRFPKEHLSLKRYIAPSELRNTRVNHSIAGDYKLYGTCNHFGDELDSGHYTAYCRNIETNRWYKYNDIKVEPVDPSYVESSGAYVLFYSKIGETVPPEVRDIFE